MDTNKGRKRDDTDNSQTYTMIIISKVYTQSCSVWRIIWCVNVKPYWMACQPRCCVCRQPSPALPCRVASSGAGAWCRGRAGSSRVRLAVCGNWTRPSRAAGSRPATPRCESGKRAGCNNNRNETFIRGILRGFVLLFFRWNGQTTFETHPNP